MSTRLAILLALPLLALLLAGCATSVTVTSTPANAAVYLRGSGRPAYRWAYRGNTPVTVKVPYSAVDAFVRWPDGSRSEVVHRGLRSGPTAQVHFAEKGPPAAPAAKPDGR